MPCMRIAGNLSAPARNSVVAMVWLRDAGWLAGMGSRECQMLMEDWARIPPSHTSCDPVT
jgi:hypothetical protein